MVVRWLAWVPGQAITLAAADSATVTLQVQHSGGYYGAVGSWTGWQRMHPSPSRQCGVYGAAGAQGVVISEVVVDVEAAATKVRAASVKARR